MSTFTQTVRHSLNDIIPIITINQLPVPGPDQWAERGQLAETYSKIERRLDITEALLKAYVQEEFPNEQIKTRSFQGTDLIINTKLPNKGLRLVHNI
jgi:hypothetical protein